MFQIHEDKFDAAILYRAKLFGKTRVCKECHDDGGFSTLDVRLYICSSEKKCQLGHMAFDRREPDDWRRVRWSYHREYA